MILGVVIQCDTMPYPNTPTRSNMGMIASASHLTRLPTRRMKQSVWSVAIHRKVVINVENVSYLQIIIHSQILIIQIITGIMDVVTTTRMILQHPLLRVGPSIPPKTVHPKRRRRGHTYNDEDEEHTIYTMTNAKNWKRIGGRKQGRDIDSIPFTGDNGIFTANVTEEELEKTKDESGDIRYHKVFEWLLSRYRKLSSTNEEEDGEDKNEEGSD